MADQKKSPLTKGLSDLEQAQLEGALSLPRDESGALSMSPEDSPPPGNPDDELALTPRFKIVERLDSLMVTMAERFDSETTSYRGRNDLTQAVYMSEIINNLAQARKAFF